MISLEPPYGARDAGGMAERIAGAAGQIDEALAHLARSPWRVPPGAPRLLAVGGLGGSAIAADLVRSFEAARLPRPMLVTRDYRFPACVDGEALALLSSYSGNTEETLAMWDDAAARGVPRVALTTGGSLAERARREGAFAMTLPAGSPPRAALYGAWVRVSALPHALGWTPDPAPAWREAADVVRALAARLGPDVPETANPAKQLARALDGRLPLVYARTARLAPVALRWRQQLHENAKLLAHDATVPELNHNEIVGWERAGWLHPRVALLVLRDDEESAEERARLTLTAEYAATRGASVHEIASRGHAPLARAAELVHVGDWVSFYLALLGGADPTAIPSIDEFKRRLAALRG